MARIAGPTMLGNVARGAAGAALGIFGVGAVAGFCVALGAGLVGCVVVLDRQCNL